MFRFLARYRIAISRVFAIIFTFVILFCHPYFYGSLLNYALLVLGLLLILIGILGRVFSSLFMSDNRHKNVVSTGIYSIVRNPLYLFSFIGTIGITLVFGSLILTIVVILFYLLYYYIVITFEENSLSEKFGLEYINYLHSGIPRFFPKFSLWKSDTHINVSYKVVLQTILDATWFFVIAIAIAIIVKLQQNAIIPVYFYLF